jgi:hypothetical protein
VSRVTAAIEHMNRTAAKIEPGTFRHEVIVSARKFKSIWVELGALLIRVRKEQSYKEWGFETFDTYCLKELHIKRQTALKLTNGYAFLEKHERELLNKPPEERPAFEVVEVLAKAEERGQLSDAEYKSIRDSIWNPPAEKTQAELVRELSQKFPAPPPPPAPKDLQLRRFAATAKRFAQELRSAHKVVPEAIRERAEALAGDLDELVKAQGA